jgi:hypothetical protein
MVDFGKWPFSMAFSCFHCNILCLSSLELHFLIFHVSAMGSRRKATRRGDASAEADAHFCGSGAYFADEGAKSLLSEGNRVVVKFSTSQDGPSQVIIKG